MWSSIRKNPEDLHLGGPKATPRTNKDTNAQQCTKELCECAAAGVNLLSSHFGLEPVWLNIAGIPVRAAPT